MNETEPFPKSVLVCALCDQPWGAHEHLAFEKQWNEEGDDYELVPRDVQAQDCVVLLKRAHQGPEGPTGAQGATGLSGPAPSAAQLKQLILESMKGNENG